MIKELVVKRGITEELKEKDQMAWVSAMEQIKRTAEEFVFDDIVYIGDVSGQSLILCKPQNLLQNDNII